MKDRSAPVSRPEVVTLLIVMFKGAAAGLALPSPAAPDSDPQEDPQPPTALVGAAKECDIIPCSRSNRPAHERRKLQIGHM
jgi:hypothetical protein